ncbi:DUF1289 domain-containing protein [Brackiella oedipodis]|uniref:DUF1289 domain-containing protein n=1 Tax=Brackiella oedipodis TaxID=124225 RepID=UPI00048BC5B4|nr:DUF1289 domain-containing protein [Brackiella oedipodis]
MEQLEIFAIPSPCIGVCESNNRGYCKGCFRSRQERQEWNLYTDPQKAVILAKCSLRKKRHMQYIMLEKLRKQEET